ncbi:hypothetical protein HBB16_15115 [Pseudonocardia sp. MCCB 268]|nr:hypothetical protein [Pseudonocardia cytotoxica]
MTAPTGSGSTPSAAGCAGSPPAVTAIRFSTAAALAGPDAVDRAAGGRGRPVARRRRRRRRRTRGAGLPVIRSGRHTSSRTFRGRAPGGARSRRTCAGRASPGTPPAAAPGAGVAAVLWTGYDAPTWAARRRRRRVRPRPPPTCGASRTACAPGTTRPVHLTVVGHSYGSTAHRQRRGPGIAADDVVFVGSPGAGVRGAGELASRADRVRATTARHDPDLLRPGQARCLHPRGWGADRSCTARLWPHRRSAGGVRLRLPATRHRVRTTWRRRPTSRRSPMRTVPTGILPARRA